MTTATKQQLIFINEIKAKFIGLGPNVCLQTIVFHPPEYFCGKPDVNSFYLKDVQVCDPCNQFGEVDCEIFTKCRESNVSTGVCCGGQLASKGYNDPRYVHCLRGGYYFVEKRMQCKKCKLYVGAYDMVQDSELAPDYMKQAYIMFVRHKTAFSMYILDNFLGDMLSGKSIGEIATGTAAERSYEYIRKRLIYLSAVDSFCRRSTQTITGAVTSDSFSPFSSLDNKNGYNEVEGVAEQLVRDVLCGTLLPSPVFVHPTY